MPAPAPLVITPGRGASPAAPASPVPVDVRAQIQALFRARQLILQELTALEGQRQDLGRTTALAYSADVAANDVDPTKAIAARDAWQTKDTLLAAQQGACNDLLRLIAVCIGEFKHTNPMEVSAVLRDQIAALSDDLSQQEKAGHLTQNQLKALWDELREVDPSCLPTMAKGPSPRLSVASKKAATAAQKQTGQK